MPVQKFRTHEEARRALWIPPGDPRIPRRLRYWLGVWTVLYPLARPRGVSKFRSIEEANASRKLWKKRQGPTPNRDAS